MVPRWLTAENDLSRHTMLVNERWEWIRLSCCKTSPIDRCFQTKASVEQRSQVDSSALVWNVIVLWWSTHLDVMKLNHFSSPRTIQMGNVFRFICQIKLKNPSCLFVLNKSRSLAARCRLSLSVEMTNWSYSARRRRRRRRTREGEEERNDRTSRRQRRWQQHYFHSLFRSCIVSLRSIRRRNNLD